MTEQGIIIKGIGGFYYVKTEKGIFECKAKGKFRKEKVIPLAGDRVIFSFSDSDGGRIEGILERKNFLKRPPVANLDKIFIVASTDKPKPNTLVIDKMTVLAIKNHIEPIIIISKTDLSDSSSLFETYQKAGFKVYTHSLSETDCEEDIKKEICGNICAFTGNSGVGKSTLINALSSDLNLETGEISDKLGRGRHTTRQAEIFEIAGGYVIDTAGFSSLDFSRDDPIFSEDLESFFPEFSSYIGECQFTGCSHRSEKGCKIIEMTNNGLISKSRLESYVTMYDEQKNLKKWNL